MLLLASLILLTIVFIAAISKKLNIPIIIIAISVGIIFGSDVTGIIYFDNAILTQKLANIALIFILFAGGYGTKLNNLKPVIKPTLILATAGVLLTAVISAVIFYFFSGWTFIRSLLLTAIISSTDAAAIFSILRTRSIGKNIASITEIESAANDPAAIITTTFIIQFIMGANIKPYISMLLFLWQLIGGVGIGVIIGLLGTFLFNKIKDIDTGYFYIFLIGTILLSYGISDACRASGMLSAFFAGFVLGNNKLPYKNGISSFTETLSFIANIGLFVLLGLLVFPKNFSNYWFYGFILFLILTFIGRPVTVFLFTLFTGLSIPDKLFISWSGIRGAVPIVLATYPLASGIDDQHQIFNIIFIAVTLSILIQGTTIGKLSDLLKLSVRNKKKPKQAMELVSIHDTDYELAEIFIDDEIYRGECRISDLNLPAGTTITMINRDNAIIAPSGQTSIIQGDVISVLADHNKIEEVTIEILRFFSKK